MDSYQGFTLSNEDDLLLQDLSCPTFSKLRKKIDDVVVHVPIFQMVSKPKIRRCPDLRFGVGELQVAQLVTLTFSPKFRSLMGINRRCVDHMALDNSPYNFTLLRGCKAVGVRPKGAPRRIACRQAWGLWGKAPLFKAAGTGATSDSNYAPSSN